MPGSRERRSDTDVRKKENHGKISLRRGIEKLTEGLDRSEVPKDAGEFYKKISPGCRDDEWWNILKTSCNSDAEKRTLSRNVKNVSGIPSNSVRQPLYAQTGKGKQNLLKKDDLEVAASPMKPSDRQPIVVLNKLAAHNGSLALNGHTLEPLERRKFFKTTCKKPTSCSTSLPGTVNGVCNGKYSVSSLRAKFGGKRELWQLENEVTYPDFSVSVPFKSTPVQKTTIFVTDKEARSKEFEGKNGDTLLGKRSTSEEIVLTEHNLSNNGKCGLMQFTDCTAELDKQRARPPTPIQMNGLHEESSILKESRSARESEPHSKTKRKASPVKGNCVAKVRKIDEHSGENERYTRSSVKALCADRSEKYDEILGDVNKEQNPQNGHVINQSNPARETWEVTVECEQESSVDRVRKWVASTLEVGFGDSDESTTNSNTLESTTASNVSCSINQAGTASCLRTSRVMSPSLQPSVVLRRLTSDEIRHYTSGRLTQRKEISQNCVEQGESRDNFEISSKDSSQDSLLSLARLFFRKYYGGHRKGYRNSYGRKWSPKCNITSSGDQGNGQSCEQESVYRMTRTPAAKLPCSAVMCKNNSQNERPCHDSCNGETQYTFDKITRRTDAEDILSEYGSVEVSSNDFSNRKVVDPGIPTATTASSFTVLVPDNRKCCRNDMCRVATPELIGLENPITSNRCWMNVTLQTLFSMENFMQSMIRAFEDVNAEDNSLISCILTLHYARSFGHQECVYEQARKLSEVLGTLNSDYVLNDQQDPSEFILWLFNAFEPALEKYGPSWASGLINENFRFEMEERTCCMGCLNFDVKISSFLILMLDIYIETSKIRTIQEALAAYTSTKTIRRTCFHCGEDKSLVKTAFKSVPRYLIINLKRYSVKEGEVIRDETPVRHCNTLSLEKYSVPNSVTNCSKDGRGVAVTSPQKFNIGKKSLRRVAGDYDLISIIHHSGFSVSSGHYVCDVYHRRTNKWYSYNDKMVKEIYEATLSSTKRQKTGYIYVYHNKND